MISDPTLQVEWPSEPDPNRFAQRGRQDGGSPNAAVWHLEDGLAVIVQTAKADLSSYTGEVETRHLERRRPHRRGRGRPIRFWLIRALQLLGIMLGGLLGVAITESAFYIFGRTPFQTLLLTVGVELLIFYCGHVSGLRIRAWPELPRRARVVAAVLLVVTLLSALTVGAVRALVLGQALPHVSLPVEFALLAGLGLLFVVAAIDAGVQPGRMTDPRQNEDVPEGELPMSAALRAQLRLGRHSLWLACRSAYLQAYRGAAAPELAAELEQVKCPEIPLPKEPWSGRVERSSEGGA